MSIEILALLMAIGSGVFSVLLGINAFFFKDMVRSLKNIELELTKVVTQHDRVIKDVEFLMFQDNKTRERLHELEGRDKMFLQFINDISKGV